MKDYNNMSLEELITEISHINPIKERDKFNALKQVHDNKYEEQYGVYPNKNV